MTLITVSFIMIMGSILLFSSLIGLNIKVSQSRGEAQFYDAETAMDEIRAGIQRVVSECLALAYEDLLLEHDGERELEEAFQDFFRTRLRDWEGGSNPLFNPNLSTGEILSFNHGILESFTTLSSDTVMTAAGVIDLRKCPDDADVVAVILRNIQIEHTDSIGYVSRVASDITINIPDFSYTTSDFNAGRFATVSLVAKNTLSNSGNAIINGGVVYAGHASLGFGGQVKLEGATMVCGGKGIGAAPGDPGDLGGIISAVGKDPLASAPAEGNGWFHANSGSTIWARRIEVEGGGSISLNGSTFVEDDFELRGRDALAWLGGSYVGFGGNIGFGTTSGDAGTSSAILVNGLGSQLNMSGLNSLSLSGLSFIGDESPIISNNNAVTGQSFTVKSDQLIYWAPAGAITPSMNPVVGNAPGSVDDVVLWNVGGTERRLSDYADPYNLTTVIAVQPTIPGGSTLFYHYINFSSREKANEYVRDYFSASGARERLDEAGDNFGRYLESFVPMQAAANAAGYLYGSNNAVTPPGNNAFPGINPASFSNLRISLTPTPSRSRNTESPDNPYDFAVNTAAVSAAGAPGTVVEFECADGKIVALILPGDHSTPAAYTVGSDFLSGDYENVRLIISQRDINVVNDFKGLILSGGNITLDGGAVVGPDPDGVIAAMSATNEDNADSIKIVHQYLWFGSPRSSSNRDSWDLHTIVRYDNWRKN
jgi:hypothetical protein